MEVIHGSSIGSCSPTNTGNLNNLDSWEVSAGVGYQNSGCAVWATGMNWWVDGFAPSGVTMNNLSVDYAKCTMNNSGQYDGGNALWYGSGGAYTVEANNLQTWSWTYNSAQNFEYEVYN